MATRVLTQLQAGYFSGGIWTTNVGLGITSSTSEPWVQVDASPLVLDVPSALSVQFFPLFNELGTLTVVYQDTPIVENFGSANLPAGIVVNSFVVSFLAEIPVMLSILLFDINGKATGLLAKLRSVRRPDSQGRYRAAFGLRWSGVGGFGQLTPTTLTFTADFGGDAQLWAPAGTDKAVECPRCGVPCLESNLVRDGVLTGLYVCASCFDPPKESDTFRWPFRS